MGKQNKHLDHLEDRIILNGHQGGKDAIKLLKTMEVHAHLSAPRVFQLSRSDTALLTRSCPLHVPCLHARHGARPDAYVHAHVHTCPCACACHVCRLL